MENTPLQKASFLVLRILGSLLYILAGILHLAKTAEPTARLEKAAFAPLVTWIAPAETLIILSGIGLLLGGVLLFVGFRTRLAALALAGILVPITLTVQVNNPEGAGPLFKNVALLGILFFFMVNGARYYSLDQVLEAKKKIKKNMKVVHSGKYVAMLATAIMFVLGSCATGTTVAQTPPATAQGAATAAAKKDYAVLISQPNHLKAAVNTAQTIKSDSKYNSNSFVIMACGKSVEAFLKDSKMVQEFEAGKAAGVTYRICGMSMKKFNIDKSQLMDGVEVVPNGLTHMFDLQLQGYNTVEL
ncbi:DsrE family protein [Pontibacter anaerobius]|uniref:DsrE family protein n=1 Tax=Pontibacter anaerobius TaxID=2993940 RepID=A0ABT3RAX0_9BACT|nr:DsrE family protein [Pontibacter anaerobius]MCX2739019.1 DsrE family protein [Pontibacter anaerobius]